MREILRHFEAVLHLRLEDEDKQAMIEASMIRNCLIHRMAIADDRLAEFSPRWSPGQPIELKVDDVHDFGFLAQRVAASILVQVGDSFD
jgi:hypothetical protein